MSSLFKIGELARRGGASVQALRLYERKGLLKPALRSAKGYRLYGVEALLRLAAIRRGQSLGFSLAELKPLLQVHPKAFATPRARRSLQAKLEEIRDRIGHLRLMETRILGILKKGKSHAETDPD
jgi:DNA-binding transcriptional MerR regulator